MLTRKKVRTSLLLIFGILLLLNFISDKYFVRLDFTEDQRYSLSEATENILSNLKDPITITAYFSEDLPPNVAKVRTDFKDLLIEYANRSHGNIVYEFIDPNSDQQKEVEAQQNGIRPLMINVREKDQVTQQKAYLGAVVQMGEKKEVIPFIQPGAAMEYALSSAIKKLSINVKPKIALVQGNGEPAENALPQLMQQLSVMYDVQPVQLTDTSGISNDYEAALIIAPKDSMSQTQLTALDSYISGGGKLLIALNTVDGDLAQAKGKSVNTGLDKWLQSKGINVEHKFVIDINCSNVMVSQKQGQFVMNTPVRFPYLPIITDFTDHPITQGLEQVILPFASPIEFNPKDTTLSFIPLAFTSKRSGTEGADTYFDITKKWTQQDFSKSHLIVAAAFEGDIDGNKNAKMVVFGDGDFAVNGSGQRAQKVSEDNINLMANAVDWLSDDTGLIQLRTKGVTGRPIDQSLDDGTKTFLKYLNFLLPIILIIGYGLFRFQIKRKIRNKLMNTDYD